MAKSNSIISVSVDNGVMAFDVAGAGSFTIDTNALSEDIRNVALLHGIRQKIADAAAMPKSELTGDAKADAATKLGAMKAVAERLMEGDWSKRSGDGAGPVSGIIFRAFFEFVTERAKAAKKTVTEAEARAVYDAKDRAGQLALRNVPEIAAIMDRIRAEKGSSAKVDAAALLGELGI